METDIAEILEEIQQLVDERDFEAALQSTAKLKAELERRQEVG
jgi:hypothetical protein